MLRVLWIATKAPWPPRDGGRLLLAESLKALSLPGDREGRESARHAEITLVAPTLRRDLAATEAALRGLCSPRLVVLRPRPRAYAALVSAMSGRPYSVTRHERPELARAVASELARERYDLVVAEQLQAFAQSGPAGLAGIPRLLRAQNVESDLWRQLGQARRGLSRALLLKESVRLERAESGAIGAAAATLALSLADAERLRVLGPPSARVEVVSPPFPGELSGSGQRLSGDPALVLFGSAGWEPNRRAERRFVDEIWPRVRAASPAAALHWFGGSPGARSGGSVADRPGVFAHPAPPTSAEAFSPGAVLVLPLDIASGVRMRVLEAWARGVVVVATPAAASGLKANDGRELLLGRNGEEFAVAIERLRTIPGLAERLIAGGRARLAADHAPAHFAARFLAIAERLARRAER